MCLGNGVQFFMRELCDISEPFLAEKNFHSVIGGSKTCMFTIGLHLTPYAGFFKAVDKIAEKVFPVLEEICYCLTLKGVIAPGVLLIQAA